MGAASNPERKTVAAAFESIPIPSRLTVPILGAPFHALPHGTSVATGDALTVDGRGHAPAAGKIIGPARASLLSAQIVDAVEIETAASDAVPAADAAAPQPSAGQDTDLPEWIDRLERAGVSSLRHGSPDLLQQLRIAVQRPVDSLICCLLDCDPNLPLNARSARSFPRELAAGIGLLSKLTAVARAWVVADPSISLRSLAALNPQIRARDLRLVQLPADYPQSDPTVLLHTLTRRRRLPDVSPAHHGVLLIDAVAAIAVGHLHLHDRPMPLVPLAVRDHLMAKSYFLAAPPGTHVADICDFLRLPKKTPVFRGGDFLRDIVLAPTAIVGPGELTLHVNAPEASTNPDPCVRCGWCMDACPTRVQPARLLEAAQRSDRPLAERFGLHACIECGICTYVCPSRLPLLGAIRKLKQGDAAPFTVLA